MSGINKIVIYEDLLKDYKMFNGWRPHESFPIHGIDDRGKRVLQDIIAVEAQFVGAYGKRHIVDQEKGIDIFGYNFMLFYAAVKKILASFKSNVYLGRRAWLRTRNINLTGAVIDEGRKPRDK